MRLARYANQAQRRPRRYRVRRLASHEVNVFFTVPGRDFNFRLHLEHVA